MADFSVPFARDANRRLALVGEKTGGFPCGEADQTLFNGLFYQIQAELIHYHYSSRCCTR